MFGKLVVSGEPVMNAVLCRCIVWPSVSVTPAVLRLSRDGCGYLPIFYRVCIRCVYDMAGRQYGIYTICIT